MDAHLISWWFVNTCHACGLPCRATIPGTQAMRNYKNAAGVQSEISLLYYEAVMRRNIRHIVSAVLWGPLQFATLMAMLCTTFGMLSLVWCFHSCCSSTHSVLLVHDVNRAFDALGAGVECESHKVEVSLFTFLPRFQIISMSSQP